MRALWTSYDNLSDINNYSKDIIVGGVLEIDCIRFPANSKKGPYWSLKQDYDVCDAVKRISFPQSDSTGQVNYANVSPIKIFYTLPDFLIIYNKDQPRIACFD